MTRRLLILLIISILSYSLSAQPQDFKQIAEVQTTPVKNQQHTGTCWAFSTVSFVETEILRETGKEFDLSEAYCVYYTYINKAETYVLYQGKHQFSEGGQAHDVLDVIREHGIVPQSDYPLKLKIDTYLQKTLKNFLDSILKKDTLPANWLKDYKKILDDSLGVPPQKIDYEGKTYTPKNFTKTILQFNPDNYIEISSFMHHDFYGQFVLEVPDNWSNALYYNLHINELIRTMEYALKNNYSFVWDGDVSEKEFRTRTSIVDMDIEKLNKSMSITMQPVRQQQFENLFTTDDHLMHCIGLYNNKANEEYFKIKNSWGEYKPFAGYLFISKDYATIKTVAILVNKKGVPEDLKKRLNIQ